MALRIGIIGAGSAGTYAALRLAQAGLEPTIFDRDRAPGVNNPCGGAVVADYLRTLEIPEELIDCKISKIIVAYGGTEQEWEFASPLIYSFQRSDVEGYVIERAVAAGAEYYPLTAARKLDAATGVLQVENLATRNHRSLEFDLVLNAGGVGCRSLATPYAADKAADAMPLCVAEYYELEGTYEPTDGMAFHLGGLGRRPGYFWIFPKKDKLNVGVGWPQSCGVEGMRALLDEFIENHPLLRGRKILRAHGGVLPIARPRRLTGTRYLKLGDAAGLVNPFTGGGLVFALRSAQYAVQEIVQGRDQGSVSGIVTAYERRLRKSVLWRWLQILDLPYRAAVRRTIAGHEGCFPLAMRGYLEGMLASGQLIAEYRSRFSVKC